MPWYWPGRGDRGGRVDPGGQWAVGVPPPGWGCACQWLAGACWLGGQPGVAGLADAHPGLVVVPLLSAEQGAAAAAMLATTTPKATWIIWRQADAKTTLPGQCGNKPLLQRVSCVKLVDDGQQHPTLLRCTPQYTSTRTRTRKLATERPRKPLGEWIQTLPPHIAPTIQVTWGWKRETTGTNKATIGLIRVEGTHGQGDSLDHLLGRSGQHGIFVEPLHWHDTLLPIKVAWERRGPDDSPDDYLQRLLDKGFHRGLGQDPHMAA
eukprot:s6007_g3.t1